MKRVFLLSSLLFSAVTLHAQNSVSLTWSYDRPSPLGALAIYSTNGTTALSGAGTSANGDGFVLQLGYYSGATSVNPFLGTWVPVFGAGSSNSLFSPATMGDGTATTGANDEFSFTGTVTDSTSSTEIGIPAAGQIMSIRYYNATSVAASTYFGAVSDDSWLWVSPTNPPPTGMSFSMYGDPGLVYQSSATEPETNIAISAVPEPGAFGALAGALVVGVALLRRRRQIL